MSACNNEFTLIKAARMIDGNGGPFLERAGVLIEGDMIRAVGTEEAVSAPEGARVTEHDYGDKTIMPGLVDCHVHLIGIGDGRKGDDLTQLPDEVLTLQAAMNARKHLYSGVTTVRDCGAKNRTTFMLRRAVEMGIAPSPRLILAGRPMAIIGGHLSYFGIEATGEVECRAAVRQLLKEGADFIKVTATGGSTNTSFPTKASFTLLEMQAMVDEAHKFGRHVAAHCASSDGMDVALSGGVDTIIHGYHINQDGLDEYRPDITDRIVNQGVFVNPTLHQGMETVTVLEAKIEESGLTSEEQAYLDKYHRSHDRRIEDMARMRTEGVEFVCGSDSAWAHYRMGAFQKEMAVHVEAGMSPMEAIVSATSDSARSCWVDGEVGSLEPGKLGDVIVVDGDPSQDIAAAMNVVDVFQGGRLIDRGNYI
ncbi:amidohydrolase family protein [Dehalococcoidia bacterium]|nr:amidohydrolase family protein [Dehalococcoidia bacterium]